MESSPTPYTYTCACIREQLLHLQNIYFSYRLISPKTIPYMGRRKVELKLIEDKTSRRVTFYKRRMGLMKKSQELAVLCDVDVAVFVFSGGGSRHEFPTGSSMTRILTRYQSHKMEESMGTGVHKKLASGSRDVCISDDLIETIQWHLEEKNIKKLDITGLNKLEQQLDSSLQRVRLRKTELMKEFVKALQEKEMQLKKEKKLMMEEIKAARVNAINNNHGDAVQPQRPVMEIQINW